MTLCALFWKAGFANLLSNLRLLLGLRATFRRRFSGRPCRHLRMAVLRRTLHLATLAAGMRRALAGRKDAEWEGKVVSS